MDDAIGTDSAPTSWTAWGWRAAVAIALLALLIGAALWVRGWIGAPATPKRQMAKIAILPDTPPPPPPPPPKEEKKPEPPKDEPKQAVREEPVRQDLPKQAEAPIKMEGEAGDGPSAFGAGSVGNEYKGGAPVIGNPGGSGGNAADRAQERFYANTVKQLLHDEIERHLRPDAGDLVATFSVWIEPDGSIRDFDLLPTGDATRDSDLRAAFEQTSQRLRLPAPKGMAQPMRFKLSVRPA